MEESLEYKKYQTICPIPNECAVAYGKALKPVDEEGYVTVFGITYKTSRKGMVLRINRRLSQQIEFLNQIEGLEQLEKLTTLDLSEQSLKSISGIEKIQNLRNLYIAGKLGLDLKPLQNMLSLEKLVIKGAKSPKNVQSIGTLKNLTSLELNYLGLGDISFLSGLVKLKELQISGNGIKDIGVLSNLSKLKSLRANYNQIEELSPLRSLKHLYELDLENNKITRVDVLGGMTSLKTLYLRHNSIEDYWVLEKMEERCFVVPPKNVWPPKPKKEMPPAKAEPEKEMPKPKKAEPKKEMTPAKEEPAKAMPPTKAEPVKAMPPAKAEPKKEMTSAKAAPAKAMPPAKAEPAKAMPPTKVEPVKETTPAKAARSETKKAEMPEKQTVLDRDAILDELIKEWASQKKTSSIANTNVTPITSESVTKISAELKNRDAIRPINREEVFDSLLKEWSRQSTANKAEVSVKVSGVEKPAEPAKYNPRWYSYLEEPTMRKSGFIFKKYEVSWDCLWFGKYPQKKNSSGGYVREPICWRILAIQGSVATLLSDLILDTAEFEAKRKQYRMVKSTYDDIVYDLNNEKNKKSFYVHAFDETERAALVASPKNINLLDYKHMADREYSKYCFNDSGKVLEKTCLCKYSEYALAQGLNKNYRYGNWLVRTEGLGQEKALFVNEFGSIDKSGIREIVGIRPMIVVDLEKTGRLDYKNDYIVLEV